MIDTQQQLLQMNHGLTPARQTCMEILDRGLHAVDAKHLTARQLSASDQALVVGGHFFGPTDVQRVFVAAFGKCAVRQAAAVEETLAKTPFFDRLAGVAICAHTDHEKLSRIKILQGRQTQENVPSIAAVNATQELIAGLKTLQSGDLVLFLVSGGASSLLVLPDEGVSLNDKVEATRQLHYAGVPVTLINQFRTCLSRVKGGGILNFVPPGVKAVSIMISDVVGDDVAHIGSGPTLWTPQKVEEVLARLEARDLTPLLPKSVLDYLKQAQGRSQIEPQVKVRNILAGNNLQGLRSAEARGREIGFQVLDMADLWDGDSYHMAHQLANLARNVQQRSLPVPPPVCFLFGGEVTVTFDGSPAAMGQGGRNQHMALMFAHFADEMGIDATRCVFASIGTDGEDGPTDAAGAIVGGHQGSDTAKWPQGTRAAMKSFNSYSFFKTNGGQLRCPVHMTNVMDYRILLLT